jgi:hypothetical protein
MRSLAILVLLAPGLAAQPLVLPPIADAMADSMQSTINFGSSPELNFGKQFISQPNFMVWFARGHVQFDTTPFFGSGLVPTRATFWWYQSQSNAAGCLDVSLHRVTAPWSEGTVTWQNQPSHDPAAISTTCVGNSFSLGWKAFDVTSLVQAWFAGSVPDFGFVIRDPNESNAGAARPGLGHSREYSNPALHPYLEIELAESFGSSCTTHATAPIWTVAGGAAIMGETIDLQLSDVLPNSLALAFFGLDNTQWNGAPLPVSRAGIGFPNCDLNVEPGVGVTIGIVASGTATLSVLVPTAASFSGMSLYSQVLALTPTVDMEATTGLGFAVWLP